MIWLLIISNVIWLYAFAIYRNAVKQQNWQHGQSYYEAIRQEQLAARDQVAAAEIQARANTLYEAADMLAKVPEAAAVRKRLLSRRNALLEQLND